MLESDFRNERKANDHRRSVAGCDQAASCQIGARASRDGERQRTEYTMRTARRDAQVLDIHLIDNYKRGYFVIVARGAKAAKRWLQDVGLATDNTSHTPGIWFGDDFQRGDGRTAPNRFAESKGAVGLQKISREEVVQRGILRESREKLNRPARRAGFADLRQTSRRARRKTQGRQGDSRCNQVFLRPIELRDVGEKLPRFRFPTSFLLSITRRHTQHST